MDLKPKFNSYKPEIFQLYSFGNIMDLLCYGLFFFLLPNENQEKEKTVNFQVNKYIAIYGREQNSSLTKIMGFPLTAFY